MSTLESLTKPLMWFMALLLVAFTAGCSGDHPVLGGPGMSGLVSISVTPLTASIPKTGEKQFKATATYSDGSTRDVTTSSTWVSGTPGVATVGSNTGLATGVNTSATPVVITATYVVGTITKTATASLTVNNATSVSFVVTPSTASIPVSGTQQFAAIETFSDGTTQNRTAASSWSSGTPGVATVGLNTGLATGQSVGTATITATYNGLAATPATLTVNAATSVSFVVTPATASIPVSGTQQFSAIETFSNGQTQNRTFDPLTVWSSVNAPLGGPAVATLSPNGATGGLATGKVAGSSTIHAVYTPAGGVAHAATPANLTVTSATVTSINVTPATASIVVNGTQQYTATAILSDGTSTDVTANTLTTWASSNALVASLSPSGAGGGLATGVAVGTSNITATFLGKTSPAVGAILTVIAGPSPGPAGPAPVLGTAAPYGIMAWDAITINAGSHIYGDVALPGGVMASVTGPGSKDGGVAPHLTASAVTNSAGVTPGEINTTDNGTLTIAQLGQLQADLNSVYTNDLLVRPAPATPLTTIASAANQPGGTFAAATDLSGYVLSPGVYTSPNTYGLSNALGPLVLDAGGNANAVFIIRSTQAGPSGLTSTTGSVVLQNGAQAKNVFWVMDNATIGAGTFFQGTVVAGHVITLGTFATVQGRMLAGALGLASGAITLAGTDIVTVPQ